MITHDGKTLTIREWAQLLDITKPTLRERLKRWPKEEALRKEKRIPPNAVWLTPDTPEGPVRRTMTEWAELRGIGMSTISRRLDRGWTHTQALNFAPAPGLSKKKRTIDNA